MFVCYFRHHFLKVHYGSDVWVEPDLIEGDSSLKTFSAGHYQVKTQPLTGSEVTSRTVSVRPRKPFSASSGLWSKTLRFSPKMLQ